MDPADADELKRDINEPVHSDRVQAILAMAGKIFAEKGFDGTSMRDISEACGVSRRSCTTISKARTTSTPRSPSIRPKACMTTSTSAYPTTRHPPRRSGPICVRPLNFSSSTVGRG